MQTVMRLGDVDPYEPDRIIRPSGDRGFGILRVRVPEQAGVEMEDRIELHAIDLPLADRKRVVLAPGGNGRVE